MVRVRSTKELVLNAIDFYRTAQPQLDTKPGTVARDLFIDGPSVQLSRLYEEVARIRTANSLRLSLGSDIDRWASNFGAVREQGGFSRGTALFTFSEIEADIPINRGDIVTANNGATFTVVNSITVSPIFANTFRAVASRFRADLDFVGITDEFAVEVAVEATSTGQLGNISRFSLISTSTPGVSNITNVVAFGGGAPAQSDSAFKTNILGIFSGANTGTALGYRNTVKRDPAVLDAIVIEPGDDLMTRDGTQIFTAEDGSRTIISEGTGGKVDIYISGTRITEIIDSFIFRDRSNRGDPTDPANDFVLGQIPGDENKTVTRRRKDNIETGILPAQPVNDIIQVSGSLSGANFAHRTVNLDGTISGNFELIRDTGAFAGSPWGFDKIRFISDRISGFSEEQTKNRFNGQDSLTFSDVLKISNARQNIQVVNEVSRVNPADRSSIQLKHFPVTNVTRVFNLTTGERYVIANQNPDGTGLINQTGRIIIRGNTLPAISDTLQVDYTWVYDYDPNFDFDNRITRGNPRTVVDSIDWGFSNAVRKERQNVEVFGDLSQVLVTHPISAIISVNIFIEESSTVSLVSGRKAVVVTSAGVNNVSSVMRDSDKVEVFDTAQEDGSFSGFTIFLPTDTLAEIGDAVTVVYNLINVFTSEEGINGSFSDNLITLGQSVSAGTMVECNYIANIRILLPSTLISSLPAIRSNNGFQTATTDSDIGTQPTTHIFDDGEIVENLRTAPSRLAINISGSISPGVITITGTTFSGIFNQTHVASNAGLRHNLAPLIRSHLGLRSVDPIPSNIKIGRLISVEKLRPGTNNVEYSFAIKGYKILDNTFVKSEAVQSDLSPTEIELPATPENINNLPAISDRLKITFYIIKESDVENVSFSTSGALYTNKTFATIDSVVRSSGFTSIPSQSATISVSNQNQPVTGSRYNVTYDYLAPKQNERITIRYNHNSLINDATFLVEGARPINADVLVKASGIILVDVRALIVVSPGFENAVNAVLQNVRDVITSALNATDLGTIVDESDLIAVAKTVEGVDRIRILQFNRAGVIGRVLSIVADRNERIQANNVVIESEVR